MASEANAPPDVLRTADPDHEAWIRSVVETHEQRLMRFAIRQIGDVELAREVVQDTLLRLWQADRAEVEGHLVQWLFTVCRHRGIDVKRKERRMSTMGHAGLEPSSNASSGDRPDDAGDTARTEQHAALLRMVEDLPEIQREVVRLKFQGGLSYREIAGVLDLTVNHVGVLLHRAIVSIRRDLVPTGADAAGTASSSSTNTQTRVDPGMVS